MSFSPFLFIKKFFYAAFFFNTPSNTHPTAEPIAKDTRYNHGLPTVRNTKIPPCGAINVQLNAIDNAPATAEPATHAGKT